MPADSLACELGCAAVHLDRATVQRLVREPQRRSAERARQHEVRARIGEAAVELLHLLRRVDQFLVLREPLGPIEQIFPEMPENRIARKDNTSDLFYEILEKGYFAVRVGDDYLASDLASRVAKVSSANCLPTTLDTVKEAKSRYHPLLWVGIRVGNRAWAEQVDGLSNMIASLQKKYPTLGVVFDGFSLPADISAESSEQRGYAGILAQENEIVASGVLARALLQHGKPQDAVKVINAVRSRAQHIQNPYVRSNFLIEASRADARIGRVAEAISTLSALRIANNNQFAITQLNARLALAEIERDSAGAAKADASLEAVQRDAETQGFLLIARQAAAMRGKPHS